MSLINCMDCHQPVSSEAVSCPTCGRPIRDRSYLTPTAQVIVGGLGLVACVAWPPLVLAYALIVVGQLVRRARHGTTRSAYVTLAALLALTGGLIFLGPPSLAPIVLILGASAAVWLVAGRRNQAKTSTQVPG